MKKSNSYWDKRALERYNATDLKTDKATERIKKIYRQAYHNIEKELESVYKNYSNSTGIDQQKLKKILSRSETEKTFKQLKRQGLDKYVQDNYKARINRLEQIKAQIYAKAKMIYPKEELAQTMLYESVLNDNYYKTVYDTQMGTGYNFSFSQLDKNTMNTLLSENWSGKHYSERIWKNTDILAERLSTVVSAGLMSGQSIEKMARQIRNDFNTANYYAERLVRTESNYFHNQADMLAYQEMGVDKYVFVATLDNRTSEICQEMDNKKFDYNKIEVGVNYPPMHPNCRSTTRGYLGDEAEKMLKRRARNPITGKTELVDNISYKEWYNQNAEQYGKEKVDRSVKKIKNLRADEEQYNRYRKALGKDTVGTLDIFRNIKYNDTNRWKELKSEFLDKIGITTERQAKNYIKNIDKTISEGKQGKHIKGHNNYKEGKSYITISIDEAQKLVDQYAGTGDLLFSQTGKWLKQELITAEKDIGFAVNKKGEKATNSFKIHYSKDGTHIVPYKKGEK